MKTLSLENHCDYSRKTDWKYFAKNDAWDISIAELIQHDEETLGFHLGCFLLRYHFETLPKPEKQDILHVLTNTGISVPEEIGMQYYLFGNGKRSAYLFMAIFIGTLICPFYFQTFYSCYKRGKKSHRFFDLDFLKMLRQPVAHIQYSFNIS